LGGSLLTRAISEVELRLSGRAIVSLTILVDTKMRTELFFLLIFTLYIGCSPTSEQTCDSDECLKQRAYDSVINVHDEVMSKMSYISELKGKIELRMNATQDTLDLGDWQRLMKNLDKADQGMYAWMHNFDSDMDDMAINEALAYLKLENKKINEVSKEINGAITEAETRLKNQN
jgi:hypothetical protein